METSLLNRLTEALDDERKAMATYSRVIQHFGPVRPFVNIVESEHRHASALLALFERYGLPLPENRWEFTEIGIPPSLTEACARGVAGEIENIAMYDRLIAATPEPDVRRVLQNLQSASRERHLPAFERCVSRGGAHRAGDGGRRHRHGWRGGLAGQNP